MKLRTIPRTAFTSYLRLARVPIDAAIGALPGNREARKLSADRADAAVRSVAASVFGDSELREDARRRREAADERAKAIKLRGEAQRRGQQADAAVEQRHEQAQKRRKQADERAKERRQSAKQTEQQRERRGA